MIIQVWQDMPCAMTCYVLLSSKCTTSVPRSSWNLTGLLKAPCHSYIISASFLSVRNPARSFVPFQGCFSGQWKDPIVFCFVEKKIHEGPMFGGFSRCHNVPKNRLRRKNQVNCLLKFGVFFGGEGVKHTHQCSLSRSV